MITAGKDWIYRALWDSLEPENTLKCTTRIPLTFLYSKGFPSKGLSSNRSEIFRVVFPLSITNILKYQREKILEFLLNNSLVENTNQLLLSDSYFCTVHYNNGEREHISLRKYDNLIAKCLWRDQVLYIQSYIPVVCGQTGFYGSGKKVRSLLEEENIASDCYARAIANYIEKSLANQRRIGKIPECTAAAYDTFMLSGRSHASYTDEPMKKVTRPWRPAESSANLKALLSPIRHDHMFIRPVPHIVKDLVALTEFHEAPKSDVKIIELNADFALTYGNQTFFLWSDNTVFSV